MDSRELQALKIIWQKGGKTPMGAMARFMGVNPDYARIILLDIGKKDYIDIARDGMCKIAEKGKEILKNRGILAQLTAEKKEKEETSRIKRKEEKEEGKPKTITLNY